MEIGSGTGSFAEQFVQQYPHARFMGLDISRTGVELSAHKVPTAEFHQVDLLNPSGDFEKGAFEATDAICSEVLEHLDEPEKLLRNSIPFMAPGCRLIVTVPGGPVGAFHRHIGHRKHYTPAELRGVLERAGFVVEYTTGIGFPFFNLYNAMIVLRGRKAIQEVAGEPGLVIRCLSRIFNALFHLNLMKFGWQIIGVARYRK